VSSCAIYRNTEELLGLIFRALLVFQHNIQYVPSQSNHSIFIFSSLFGLVLIILRIVVVTVV
jgi:hypothetical protein